jgi:hypothetical protein
MGMKKWRRLREPSVSWLPKRPFVGPGLGHAHLGPVGLQLVGDHHRDGRADALAHLLAVAGDRDRAVLGDGDEKLRVVAPAVRHAVGAEAFRLLRLRGGRDADGEDQGAGAYAGQEAAAADVGDAGGGGVEGAGAHVLPPFAAACLMAARMRG